MLDRSSDIVLVFVISGRAWRGDNMRAYLTEFSQRFKNFDDVKDKIVYVFNRMSEEDIQEIHADLQKYKIETERGVSRELRKNSKAIIESLI